MTEENQFSESAYYTEYKSIRNHFRSFNKNYLIDEILIFLYENYSNDSLEQLKKLPWAQLLLIKWILIDDNINFRKNKTPKRSDVLYLAQRMHDIQSHCRMPHDYQDTHIFMRNMAFQQFHYQSSFNSTHLGRQIHLFVENKNYRVFNEEFHNTYGISIIKFIEISSCIFSIFSGKNSTVSLRNESFIPLIQYFTEESIEKYLCLISENTENLIHYLREESTDKRLSREYFEQSPLLKFPFLCKEKFYICWYPTIFFRCVEHFVYDRLRDIDKPKFMDRFGNLFESYVEELILLSKEDYLTEDTVSRHISGKVVDFIIYGKKTLVYIDAKAVETKRTVRNSTDPNIIRDRINDSIISAIDQAHNTHNQIGSIPQTRSISTADTCDSYILVITYKEMYIGNGKTLYDVYAKDKIEDIFSKYKNNIPVENIYFLTIEEFEFFCELVRSAPPSMADYIKRAAKSDSDPVTKKYNFMLHINEWGGKFPPSFLREAYVKVFERLTEAFSK